MFSAKTVLLVGEDALAIYASSGGRSKRLGILYWEEENLVERIIGYLLREGGKKPVVILYDMLEQQYKKEIVPKLSILDRQSYIDRKLRVVFPSNPMRAAYFLKGEAEENLLNGKNNEEGSPYIFASIPDMNQMQIVYDAIVKSEMHLIGVGLLPVEGAGLIKKIATAAASGGHKAKWAVLLSVHESGWLRQIVIKNGELALTRLTAVASDSSNAEDWAAEAGLEFKSTLSYLLRFGYSQDQPMDIYLVHGAPGVVEAFKSQINIEPNVIAGSPEYFAKMCGLKLKNNQGSIYGDGLHAAWASKKAGFRLPLSSGRFDHLVKIRKACSYFSKAVYLIAFCGLAYASYIGKEIIDMNDRVANEQRMHASLLNELNQKEMSIPTIVEGVEYDKIINLLDVYDKLESEGIKSFALINAIGQSMPENVTLSGLGIEVLKVEEGEDTGMIDVVVPDDGAAVPMDDEASTEVRANIPTPPYEIKLNIGFKPTIGLEAAVFAVKEFHENLVNLLQGYEVEITRQVANLSSKTEFSENLSAELAVEAQQSNAMGDDGETEESPEDMGQEENTERLTAEIIITGKGQ